MIALAVDELTKYVFEQVKEPSMDYDDLTTYATKLDVLMEKLLEAAYEAYIIDLDVLQADDEDIAACLKKLYKVSTAQIIIAAKGHDPSSNLIAALRMTGFCYFLLSESLGDLKQQMRDCLNGTKNADDLNKSEKYRLTSSNFPQKRTTKYRTVGFMGSMPRVGTTTQAIQLVKYLQSQGYTACYIEAAGQKQICQIPDLYAVEIFDKQKGFIRFESTDLYYNPFALAEIQRENYNVCVYDFGRYKPEILFSFLDTDMRICVSGIKPWEIDSIYPVMRRLEDENVTYAFSFTPQSAQKEILNFMEEKKDTTFFPAYTPEMHSLSSVNRPFHEHILKELQPQKSDEKKKKKFLFRGDKK